MAEAMAVVGFVAATIGLVSTGKAIVERIKSFTSDLEDIPEAFRDICTTLPVITISLDRIREQKKALSAADESALEAVVDGCSSYVSQLEAILDDTLPKKGESSLDKGIKALKSLNKDKRVERIRIKLRDYIQILILYQASQGGDEITVPLVPAVRILFTVPFDRDTHFIARSTELAEIWSRFDGGKRRIALAGMGGIGKSQIAIEFCYQWRGKHKEGYVFWIFVPKFDQMFRELAKTLNLPEADEANIDKLALVCNHLTSTEIPWLMVLDNADDADIFMGEGSLARYLPAGQPDFYGQLLITTRDVRVGQRLMENEEPIYIKPLGTDDASLLLETKLPPRSRGDSESKTQLLRELNNIPLAIVQAAGFILENRITVADYLEILRNDEESADLVEMLEEPLPDSRRDQGSENSVIRTWMVSLGMIREKSPRAVEMLSLMSCLNRQAIPKYLLHKPKETPLMFWKALAILHNFSLIEEESDHEAFGMHRLVQLSTQRWLKINKALSLTIWKERALSVVRARFPEDIDSETWNIMIPHAEKVLTYENVVSENMKEHCKVIRMRIDKYKSQALLYTTVSVETNDPLDIGNLYSSAEHAREEFLKYFGNFVPGNPRSFPSPLGSDASSTPALRSLIEHAIRRYRRAILDPSILFLNLDEFQKGFEFWLAMLPQEHFKSTILNFLVYIANLNANSEGSDVKVLSLLVDFVHLFKPFGRTSLSPVTIYKTVGIHKCLSGILVSTFSFFGDIVRWLQTSGLRFLFKDNWTKRFQEKLVDMGRMISRIQDEVLTILQARLINLTRHKRK